MGHKGQNRAAASRWALSALPVAAIAGSVVLLGAGCGGEDDYVVAEEPPSGRVRVTVAYPNEEAQAEVSSLHLWVLESNSELRNPELCAKLVGGDLEPHDFEVVQLAEVVEIGANATLVARGLESGRVLVYVEAVDHRGQSLLAGCVPKGVTDGEVTRVELEVDTAGVYDCANEATPNGAPCDDGQICTQGETCLDGECQGGGGRSCSHLSMGCLRGVCQEAAGGCTTEPIDDGDPCETGLYCIVGGTCQGGVCTGGTERDCSSLAGQCQVATGCNEAVDQCQFGSAPAGTSCDDGSACTDDDQCDGAGACVGTAAACDGPCHTGACDSATGACVNRPAGTLCGDQSDCGTQCDASGSCIEQVASDGTECDDGDPLTTEDQCVAGVCTG